MSASPADAPLPDDPPPDAADREARRAQLRAGGAAPLEVTGPTRTLRVWRASAHGVVAIMGFALTLVGLGVGVGLILDTGPEPAAFVFMGAGVLSGFIAAWAARTGKEALELGLDLPSDSLVLRRGAIRHVLPRQSSFTRARFHQVEAGAAVGAGDATLHVNLILIERGPDGALALPERFQDGDSRRVAAAIGALFAAREHWA